MTENRWKPQGKWIVQAIDHKIDTPDENATPKRWRSFSPGMWSLYKNFIRALQQPILWDEFTYDLYDTLSRYMLPEQPPETECPECPEPPPPEPSGGGGGGGGNVGILGMTIEELEEIVMGISLRGLLKEIDGKLHFAGNGCDDWCPVPEEGEPTVASVQSAINAGIQAFDDWIEAGSPPVQDVEQVPHDKYEIYTTDDSLKCAKASAIVEHIWQAIAGWKEVMDNLPATVRTATGVGTVLASVFPDVAYGLSMISKVIVLLSQFPSSAVAEQLQTDYEKTDLKHDLLCDLVPRMAAPGLLAGVLRTNRMTDADIVTAFERFEAIVSPHANTRALLGFFPIAEWKAATASRMQTEECGCDDFMPYGYTPPLPEGQMMYSFTDFGFASPAVPFPSDGTEYEEIFVGGQRGVLFGGNPTTIFTVEAGGDYASFLQAIYHFTSPVEITGIKILLSFPDGTPSVFTNWSNKWLVDDDPDTWEFGAGWGNYNDSPEVRALTGTMNAFSIGVETVHTGSARRGSILQVLVSGTFNGSVFTDLPPNEIFES